MTTGLASDYTESIKQHKIEGQNLTMWEQFLTGTQEQFKTLGEQVKSAYETGVTEARQASAYDISQAYSNYKKQQLSLQMQEQLGAGFKQQLGSELKSAYDITYSGLEKQRESALSKLQSEYVSSLTELGEEYETAVKKGESEFAKLGEQAQAFDRLIHQYAEEQGNVFSDTYINTTQGESGEIIKELSDEGRLWYSSIFDDENFQKWFLKGDGDLSDTELKNREELYEEYRKNPDLFKQAIAGIGGDFDAEEVKTRIEEQAKQAELDKLKAQQDAAQAKTPLDISILSTDQLSTLNEEMQRNENLVSKHTHPSYNYNNKKGETLTDDYGQYWTILPKEELVLDNYTPADIQRYERGDIISLNDKYYIVDSAIKIKGVSEDYGQLVLKEIFYGGSQKPSGRRKAGSARK